MQCFYRDRLGVDNSGVFGEGSASNTEQINKRDGALMSVAELINGVLGNQQIGR